MGRLIDADVYCKTQCAYEGECSKSQRSACTITAVPTAYDVDKVVAKLEEEYITSRCLNGEPCEYPETIDCCYDRAITKAIEIVKRGGVDG